jgi:UDP-2,3-diacylglucosamine pyrophosphatase LpxH
MGHKWISLLGSWAYDYLITINRVVNAVRRRFGMPYWSLSGAIKRRVKRAVKHLSDFENLLSAEARRVGVDGVICGHTHQPAMRQMGDILYCNTGDWVENCTALVEHTDGKLELIWWHPEKDARVGEMAAAVEMPYACVAPSLPLNGRGISPEHELEEVAAAK